MCNNNTYIKMAMKEKDSLIQNLNYHSKANTSVEKVCTHCDNSKHIVESHFKLHSYLD